MIVRFGAAAGKDDFIRPAPDQIGDLTAGFYKGLFWLDSIPVSAGWVSEFN